MTIQLTSEINNASLQIGDRVYALQPNLINSASGQLVASNINIFQADGPSTSGVNESVYIGIVTGLTHDSIIINDPVNSDVPIGSFLMFSKNNVVNAGGLKGYYANVKLQHTGKERAELFAISSEVTESSK